MMYGRGYYGAGSMMGGGWFASLFMLLFGALLIAAVVLLILWAIRAAEHAHGGSMTQHHPTHDEAVSIARRRLATGEITKEQFDEIMRALGT